MNIQKIKVNGQAFYPATIVDAVKDSKKTVVVDGSSVANPHYGQTVREMIAGIDASIAGVDAKVGALADLTTTEKASIVGAINEVNAVLETIPSNDTVVANAAAIATLTGDGEGSVAKAVADEVANRNTAITTAIAGLDSSASGQDTADYVEVAISLVDGKLPETGAITVTCNLEPCTAADITALFAEVEPDAPAQA